MNPAIFPPAMSKIVGQTVLFSIGMATRLGVRKLNTKLLNSMLKINLVLYPANVERLVNVSFNDLNSPECCTSGGVMVNKLD